MKPTSFKASRLTSRSTRRRQLWSDRGGAAIVEFAMASMPVFDLFFGMIQWSICAYIHLILKHAAFVAARCDAVVAPDMPDAGKESDCQKGAVEALFAHVHGVEKGEVKVHLSNPSKYAQTADTVTLDLDYKCTIPLGDHVACKGRHMKMTEKASFPNQGSYYQKVWGVK